MALTEVVNVFQGNGEIDLPAPQGVAASWHFIKALTGNTHPGAARPFGKLTACTYSAGYSSGYGTHRINCGGPIRKLYTEKKFIGVSHLHQSGIGALGFYYNYVLTIPFVGELTAESAVRSIVKESAHPGYYTVTSDDGITTELTVSETCAHHRYTFPGTGGKIAVDFTNDGLYDGENVNDRPRDWRITRRSATEAEATVTLQGVAVHFYVACKSATSCSLWTEDSADTGDAISASGDAARKRGGCLFLIDGRQAEIVVSVSLKSTERARTVAEDDQRLFDEIAADAEAAWEVALSKIEIETDDAREREIFYSNFYHTLVKPSNWRGESVLYENEEFMLDFCTLWDLYKTQLPLLFTLYSEISEEIVTTYQNLSKALGILPHTFVLCDNFRIESKQAQMLGVYLLYDAWVRGVGDARESLEAIKRDLAREEYRPFFETGACAKTTHTLDIGEGCAAIAEMARACGEDALAERMETAAEQIWSVFDRETGLLRADADYYEGNHWNYSFRLLRNMARRVNLCGTKENYLALCDRFFGYTHAEDVSGRFEGFNNETDMEAPYAYIAADRHDRLCEVITWGTESMFTTGAGGIPGNNDSGGLSACYLWNVLGIFPASGQDRMYVGTPRYARACLHLANGETFEICRSGTGIYVRSAKLNGRLLDEFAFGASEMMRGGVLELEMSETP
ncbi:MAG: glycoside hydrolase family 92 protein [Clostridia bacterium]|nr:glycoside hydrolase family 92 protein [Clostridia bacterium]